jgi:hypothetical protein
MCATINKQGPGSAERRAVKDRRVRDVDMPANRDRRRGVEPRKPEVSEIEPTDSMWASFEVDPPSADR